MNKQQAYSEFWSGFGVLAFEENSVPTEDVVEKMIEGTELKKYPYITYEVLVSDINDPVFASASIHDRNTSWERIDLLANEISEAISKMKTIKLDNGRMFITKGSPFAQHMSEEEDLDYRRVVLNLGIEFFTEY